MFKKLFSKPKKNSNKFNEPAIELAKFKFISPPIKYKLVFNACLNELRKKVPLIPAKTINKVFLPRELNLWENLALQELKKFDLTAPMLIHYYENNTAFTKQHWRTLKTLVLTQHSAEALETMKHLSLPQLKGIEHGLNLEDVIHLHNAWHIQALLKFKKHYLTADMLLNHDKNGPKFGRAHLKALTYLLSEPRSFSIDLALQTMEGFTSEQVIHLTYGLTREEILNRPGQRCAIFSHSHFGV